MKNNQAADRVFAAIDFSKFKNRAGRLKSIGRYRAYTVMYYRTNVLFHSQRACWLLEELIPHALKTIPGFDPEKARILTHIHDDPEMITGDVNLVHKIRFSQEQKNALEKQEEAAIENLIAEFPKKITGYSYGELLWNSHRKDCVEAQVMKLADRLDGYGESCHEVFAGNKAFLWPEDITPVELYSSFLKSMAIKFPLLTDLLHSKHPLLAPVKDQNIPEVVARGKPHTSDSIFQSSGIPQYDFWKHVTIKHLGEKGIEILTSQKELGHVQK